MARKYVDRGSPLNGIQSTARDARLPFNFARDIVNFSLIDGRATRRAGQSLFSWPVANKLSLAKTTGTEVVGVIPEAFADSNSTTLRTPLSYGLLRWHDDFQLKSTEDKTIEFAFTVGDEEYLVANNARRKSITTYGASVENLEPCPGVKILEQGLLANKFTYRNAGGTTYNVDRNGVGTYVDTFNLCTFQVTWDSDGLHVGCALVDTVGKSYQFHSCVNPLPNPTSGESLRVSLVYDSTTTELSVYFDGDLQDDSLVLPSGYVFAGEQDYINGYATNTPLQRDIVILNDSVARAGYASSAKIGTNLSTSLVDHGYQSYERAVGVDDLISYVALSPPKNTALCDLRFWSVARSLDDILNDYNTYATVGAENLVSYFKLDNGLPYCKDEIVDYRYITIHKGEAALIEDTGMPHGKALVFADNQYLNLSYEVDAHKGISPSYGSLRYPFTYTSQDGMSAQHDFTVQMRIRTPHTFGQELNRVNGDTTLTNTNGDTRQSMDVQAYALSDGRALDNTWATQGTVRDEAGNDPTVSRASRYHRSFDATLWSVEGAQVAKITKDDNYNDVFRSPITRGLLTPSGLVAFEFFGVDNSSPAKGREFRLVSATTLAPNTVYTITFRKRALFYYDSSTGLRSSYGFELAIFLDGNATADATVTIGISGGTRPATDITVPATVNSGTMPHGGVREINIGASYVGDNTDRSISYPQTGDTNTLERRFVQQRYMSPYQDQPGFFSLGMFRMWTSAVDGQSLRRTYAARKIDQDASLLFDLQIKNSGSRQIPDSGPFSEFWTLGHKSWGIPQYGYVDASGNGVADSVGWLNADRLGYKNVWSQSDDIIPPFTDTESTAECHGLAYYASTLGQEFGILGMFRGTLHYSRDASGIFNYVHPIGDGILCDYENSRIWRGTAVADRTVLTSYGGTPKVYNGNVVSSLGFKSWGGGGVIARAAASSPGTSLGQGWYGIRIIYWSDKAGIYQVSPQYAIYVDGTINDFIEVAGISAHPDPRVTSLGVAVTIPQESESLAKVSPVYLSSAGFYDNTYLAMANVTGRLESVLIPTDITLAPQGAFSASYNSRLYIAGDPNIPDIVYFSDAGNIERWDTLANRIVLEDGTGDRIVNIKAMFGSLYVFKPNSIWRVDELGGGQHQVVRVSSIGPISSEAIELISIPDSGRVAILFWSRHGPYLFDEVNLQYVGFNIEGEGEPFSWLDPTTVTITHDIANRSVWFNYKAVDSDYYGGAAVYNYRFNTWCKYAGIVSGVNLSVDMSKSIKTGYDGFSNTYLALIGAHNGAIYSLGDSVSDGFREGKDAPISYGINTVNEGVITLREDPELAENVLAGLWATFVNSEDESWYSLPILGNVGVFLKVDPTYDTDPTFTLKAGDKVYIGYSPASIEFPWDQLDVPYFNKQIQRLVIWARGYFFYRLYKNWDLTQFTSWEEVDTRGDRRINVDSLRANAEAFKFKFASFDPNSRLNAYAALIDYQGEGNK